MESVVLSNLVWTAMKNRKVIVNDAASFVRACNAPKSTVEVFEMSGAEEYDTES